jgi:hypothetical protein
MEIINNSGKFTITEEGGKIIINEWQGETKSFPAMKIPTNEVAACLQWLDKTQANTLRKMIGDGKFNNSVKYALKWRWIEQDVADMFLSISAAAAPDHYESVTD